MKNLMALLSQPKFVQGFQQRQMEHMANNPVHQDRVRQAFDMKSPKTKMHSPHPDQTPGSPWLNMTGEKK